METDKNFMPEIKIGIVDLVKAAGGCALELFKLHLLSPVSDHFQAGEPHRGAAAMLDRELYDGK